MSHSQTALQETASGYLPGSAIIARIRRLAVIAVIAGVTYSTLTQASRGGCAGGAEGAYADAATGDAPQCYQLTMHANPLVVVAIALIVVFAIGRVLRAESISGALRTLDRAGYLVMAIAGVSLIVAQVWFALIPVHVLESESFTLYYPAPFAMVDLQLAPTAIP
ncbi:hypothetical protein ACH3VR_09930 [Microbacterium sp. B2969]|uniref:Uncharacterized protein n=1 Tax=Microbacterium alkaliflavum TaxID=3248839 RepID=A0ABW7Q749_9MICO